MSLESILAKFDVCWSIIPPAIRLLLHHLLVSSLTYEMYMSQRMEVCWKSHID